MPIIRKVLGYYNYTQTKRTERAFRAEIDWFKNQDPPEKPVMRLLSDCCPTASGAISWYNLFYIGTTQRVFSMSAFVALMQFLPTPLPDSSWKRFEGLTEKLAFEDWPSLFGEVPNELQLKTSGMDLYLQSPR